MKTIQCAHPPHHHNGFVATCRLWTASGGVHALLVLKPTHQQYIYIYIYIYIVEVWREKKYAQKSAEVSDLVISRDASLKISNKNEPNTILTKFHDFILGLFALNDLTITYIFFLKNLAALL